MDSSDGRIISAKLIETPATAPVFVRPMDAHLDGRAASIYEQRSDGGRYHSESLLAEVANSVMGYSTAPERRVQLPGGYDQCRFRIIIEYLETRMNNTEKVSYIVGYTDHDERLERGGGSISFDKSMRVYFNTISSLTRSRSGRGGRTKYKVNDRSHVLTPPDLDRDDLGRRGRRVDRWESDDAHMLIPSVIAGHMNNDNLGEIVGMNVKRSQVDDTRSSIKIIGSKRTSSANSIPSVYMSKVLAGYDSAKRNRVDREASNLRVLGDVMDAVQDDVLSNSAFFHDIIVNSEYNEDGYITWGQLCRLYPELDDDRVTECSPLGDHYRHRPGVDNVEHWDNTDMESIIANILVSSIPPMMSELLFEEIELSITNDTADGEISIAVDMYHSLFEKIDLRNNLDTLIYRIKHYLLAGQPWTLPMFHITATLSTRYESVVDVEYDDDEARIYRFASYADALATPLLSLDGGRIDNISNSLESLMEVIDTKYEESAREELRGDDRDDRSDRGRGRRSSGRGVSGLILPDDKHSRI